MAKFKKKPIVIDAIECSELRDAIAKSKTSSLPEWVMQALRDRVIEISDPLRITIVTIDCGRVFCSEKNWIIKGTKGELYPCLPGIFKQIYEPVDA